MGTSHFDRGEGARIVYPVVEPCRGGTNVAAHGMMMGHREPRSHTVGLATATGMAGRTDPQAVMAMAQALALAHGMVGKTPQAAQDTVGMVVARA